MRDYGDLIDDFIKELKGFQRMENVFNPWANIDAVYDVGENAQLIRCSNLKKYLLNRKNAKFVLIAEAPGYQGCHFSGIAMTSERIILKNKYNTFVGMKRSSQKEKLQSQPKIVQNYGFCEPTATIVWKQMVEKLHIKPGDFILWNVFPFHPYNPYNILSNRTPSAEELEQTEEILKEFLYIFKEKTLIAVGNTSQNTLKKFKNKLNITVQNVRHPSYGGAAQFCKQITSIMQ